MLTFFQIYIVFSALWAVGSVLFILVKPILVFIRGRFKDAPLSQIKEIIRNVGISIAASGFFGMILSISEKATILEIFVKLFLAIIFLVIGALVVSLGLDKK